LQNKRRVNQSTINNQHRESVSNHSIRNNTRTHGDPPASGPFSFNATINCVPLEFFPAPAYAKYPRANRLTPCLFSRWLEPWGSQFGSSSIDPFVDSFCFAVGSEFNPNYTRSQRVESSTAQRSKSHYPLVNILLRSSVDKNSNTYLTQKVLDASHKWNSRVEVSCCDHFHEMSCTVWRPFMMH
jgi:hypothetical protein